MLIQYPYVEEVKQWVAPHLLERDTVTVVPFPSGKEGMLFVRIDYILSPSASWMRRDKRYRWVYDGPAMETCTNPEPVSHTGWWVLVSITPNQ